MWGGNTKNQKVQRLLHFAHAQDMEVTYLIQKNHLIKRPLQSRFFIAIELGPQ